MYALHLGALDAYSLFCSFSFASPVCLRPRALWNSLMASAVLAS